MLKIATTLTVLSLALAGSAFAQDFRSPDARPAVVQQDYRSPDSQAAGAFQPSVPSEPAHASGSFDWGYLALGIATPLILLGGFVLTQRRRRESLAVGS